MADLKISQLATESPLAGTEEVEVVTGGVNKKTTTSAIAALGGGGGSWGSITGTLSSQTDLQAALDAKEDESNKATTFGTVDNTLYPTVQAVKNYVDSGISGAQAGGILYQYYNFY